MSITHALINNERIECLHHGDVIPDHNLIYNIDHMISFIEMDIEAWKLHSDKLNKDFEGSNFAYIGGTLLKEQNSRVYLKTLFSIATCYVALNDAFQQLINQLQVLNKYCNSNVKKVKLDQSSQWFKKVKYIRHVSYIHQNSSKELNSLNKKAAMTWNVTISTKNDVVPNCESYRFGEWKYTSRVDENKISDVDIGISGLLEFSEKALMNANKTRQNIIEFHQEIKHNKQLKQDAAKAAPLS